MKQAATLLMSIYFTIGSLFPLSDFSQLLQIGELLEHYEQHRSTITDDSQLSFYEVFVIHFMNHDDHEDPEHANLPLMSIDSSMVLMAYEEEEVLHYQMDTPAQDNFTFNLPQDREFNISIFEPPI